MHKLDSIAKNVRECKKCELCETRIMAVPGKGNFDADVIFVGEAQGKNEEPAYTAAAASLCGEDSHPDTEAVVPLDTNHSRHAGH